MDILDWLYKQTSPETRIAYGVIKEQRETIQQLRDKIAELEEIVKNFQELIGKGQPQKYRERIAELEAKYNELDIRCTGYYHDIETMAIKRAELDAKLEVAREALEKMDKIIFARLNRPQSRLESCGGIVVEALNKIGDK